MADAVQQLLSRRQRPRRHAVATQRESVLGNDAQVQGFRLRLRAAVAGDRSARRCQKRGEPLTTVSATARPRRCATLLRHAPTCLLDRLHAYRESLNQRRKDYAGMLDTTGVDDRGNERRRGPGAHLSGRPDHLHRRLSIATQGLSCWAISTSTTGNAWSSPSAGGAPSSRWTTGLRQNTPFPRRSTMRLWCSNGRPTMRPNCSSTPIGWRSPAAVREEHWRRGSYSVRPRGAGPTYVFQLLHQPVLDDRPTPSKKEFEAAPGFDGPAVRMMWQHYLAGAPASADAAPARCAELSGLPSTLITCSELDPLRDEAIGYAQRLMSSGVATELHVFPGTCHGFDAFLPDWEMSRQLFGIQGAALRRALHT